MNIGIFFTIRKVGSVYTKWFLIMRDTILENCPLRHHITSNRRGLLWPEKVNYEGKSNMQKFLSKFSSGSPCIGCTSILTKAYVVSWNGKMILSKHNMHCISSTEYTKLCSTFTINITLDTKRAQRNFVYFNYSLDCK